MTLKINDNGTDRDMTDKELASHEQTLSALQADTEQLEQKLDAINDARHSAKNKLRALGLTDAEIAALVG